MGKKIFFLLIILIISGLSLNTVESIKIKNKEKEFYKYYHEWNDYIKKSKIQFSSFSKDFIDNEPYNKIIKMGIIVVPMIIKEIKNGEWMLFYALEKITKENPYNDDEIIKHSSEQQKAMLWVKWWEKGI